jgi:CubicO group peptidase (beta-lactamase class C family)
MQFLNTVKQYRNLLVSIIIFILLVACQMTPKWAPYSAAAGEVYPNEKWQKLEPPEKLGWSSEKLAEARAYSKRIGSAAVMIVDNGVVVDAWGNTSRNFQCHSMRKSLISALIGIHVEEGNINLTKTMEELTIDDYEPSLTSEEKQATINDLIRARSGIYHAALGESQGMKATRPKRHSHPHGTFWYYNNWDFNTIGTIFEQETVTKIFEEFNRRLAKPLQMEDFKIRRCSYKTWRNYDEGKTSMHRYYLFRVSTRDLARIGLLFLRQGRWHDRQIVSAEWVKESTAGHSKTGPNSGYGYMWWTGVKNGLFSNVHVKSHSYYAAGYRGHYVIVLPYRNLVIVHRVNTDLKQGQVSNRQIGRLLWHILDAAGETEIGEKPTLEAAKGVQLTGDILRKTLAGCRIRGSDFTANLLQDNTFEIWMNGNLLDTGKWWVKADKCWMKGKVITGGRKGYVYFVKDGDKIKWYDREGTLDGEGVYSRTN